jgi:hypothetical protein
VTKGTDWASCAAAEGVLVCETLPFKDPATVFEFNGVAGWVEPLCTGMPALSTESELFVAADVPNESLNRCSSLSRSCLVLETIELAVDELEAVFAFELNVLI